MVIFETVRGKNYEVCAKVYYKGHWETSRSQLEYSEGYWHLLQISQILTWNSLKFDSRTKNDKHNQFGTKPILLSGVGVVV